MVVKLFSANVHVKGLWRVETNAFFWQKNGPNVSQKIVWDELTTTQG